MAATTPARCETTCILCDAPVKIGDEIFPAAEATKEDGHGPGKLRWAHGVCFGLLPNPERWRPPLCRCWLRRGRCPMLEAGCCAFGHPEDHRGAEEGQGARRWGGRRRLVRNGHRAAALRVFLQATLSLEGLRSGTVLDVAGGKGTLSWELINCVGASHCVVVDPRPLDTRYLVKKWRSGHYEPHRTGTC